MSELKTKEELIDSLIHSEEFRKQFEADRAGVLGDFKLTGDEQKALLEEPIADLINLASGRGAGPGRVMGV